jgi:hypothetical protein
MVRRCIEEMVMRWKANAMISDAVQRLSQVGH